MKKSLKSAYESKSRVIFVDESMFTTATRLSSAFSNTNNNIIVQERLLNSKALAVVAGVSIERGLEGYLLKDKSINSHSFI